MSLLLLFISAIISSTISGVIGMGGGVLLLSLMTFFFPYQVIIPLHGVAQLASNGMRSFYLKEHIIWSCFKPFIMGVPLGVAISYGLLSKVKSPHYFYLILAIFIIYVIFKPKKLPEIKLKSKGWFFLGIASGIQGPLLGATGPLIAPFFRRSDISKEKIVATKSALQIVTHLIKIPLFLSLSFNYAQYSLSLLILIFGVFLGTSLGVRYLKMISEQLFVLLFKGSSHA